MVYQRLWNLENVHWARMIQFPVLRIDIKCLLLHIVLPKLLIAGLRDVAIRDIITQSFYILKRYTAFN